jgi:hypothetical protein
MSMLHRLFRLLAFAMIALLPSQASYATVGCAPMQMAMEAPGAPGECDDCRKDVVDSCRSFCGTMCQSVLDLRSPNFSEPSLSGKLHFPLSGSFLVLGLGGPDPPPPRLED